MERVYLDTSFFIGLLENQENRQDEARRILEFESGNDRFTSQLTLNEFMVRAYNDFKDLPDCETRVEQVDLRIRSIARVVAISDEICKRAALLQSTWGQIHKHANRPKEARDRGFRWDAIHLATAYEWKCNRIYAWDGKWESLPEQVKSGLGEIIAPAKCPGLFSWLEEALAEEPEPVPDAEEPQASDLEAKTSAPSAPDPPSEPTRAAPPESTSLPEPSPPSVPLADPEQPQRPG